MYLHEPLYPPSCLAINRLQFLPIMLYAFLASALSA